MASIRPMVTEVVDESRNGAVMINERKPDAGQGQQDRLWTIQDVSAFLSVPVPTLYGWRHRGDGPPAMRLGKHLRFEPGAVRRWAHDQAA